MKKIAHVVDVGFDENRVLRYVVFSLEPPLKGKNVRKVFFSAADTDGLPLPISDELLGKAHKALAQSFGYELAQ